MIDGLFDGGAMPVLDRMIQFSSARHQVLAHNIANLSTPHFRPRDLDPAAFQKQLRTAIDQRRAVGHPVRGELQPRESREIRFESGRLAADPQPVDQGILFHDRNNRDLERTMQQLAENTLAHRAGVELMRNQFEMLSMAIRGRL